MAQIVYIVCAEGEESLARELAAPLGKAGYDVAHNDTVSVGDSLIGAANAAVASGAPIVLCATVKSVGSTWSHQIVNAGRVNNRVFVVLMEKSAYVEHLSMNTKVARYCDDPVQGMSDLVAALARHFPPGMVLPVTADAPDQRDLQFLDQSTDVRLDHAALQHFRDTMREEIAARHPAALTPMEFLERGMLVLEGRLTRTGALLFGERPAAACPTAMVKCVRYYGATRAEQRESLTFEGPIAEQIIAARDFVARRVQRGERPSSVSAESVPVYDYPMIAVREIIANALVHRDYSVDHACVHVRLFSDRLEISSPGSWLGRDVPVGVPLDLTTLVGHSIKRNFRLAHVLSWVRLVEGEGSGIPTVLSECDGTSVPAPTVLQEQGFITVTLRPLPRFPERVESGGWAEMPVPMQVPMAVSGFVGRDQELEKLRAQVISADSSSVAVISGMGGVGKTTLAMRFAHQAADRFPDGQLFAVLHDDTDPADTLAGFLTALGVPGHRIPADTTTRAALYRSLLSGRRTLVVLDNVVDVRQIEQLLPGSDGNKVVVTSRSNLGEAITLWGASTQRLDVLSKEASMKLLADRVGSERVAEEPEAAEELVAMCGQVPVALAVAAAYVRSRSTVPLADVVEAMRARWSVSTDTTVRATFDWSYQHLSPDAQRVFRDISVHPGPDIGIGAVRAVSSLPDRATDVATAELHDQHLLEEHLPNRYRVHDLLRRYARDLMDSRKEREAAERRMFTYYVEACANAGNEWIASEEAVLRAVISEAGRAGLHEQVCLLAFAVTPYLESQGRWEDVVHVQTSARDSAARIADHLTHARSLARAATALEKLGRDEEARKWRHDSAEAAKKISTGTVTVPRPASSARTVGGQPEQPMQPTQPPEEGAGRRERQSRSTAVGQSEVPPYFSHMSDEELLAWYAELQSRAMYPRPGDVDFDHSHQPFRPLTTEELRHRLNTFTGWPRGISTLDSGSPFHALWHWLHA